VIRKPLSRNWKIGAAVPVILAGAACYQYRTSGRDAVMPGQVVHVDLTAPGAAALAPAIGPNATALNGKVLTRAGNDLTLAVTQIDRGTAPEQFLKGEPISLSFDNVSGIRMRRFDKQRTVLAIGGIIAAVVAGQAFLDQSGLFTSKGVGSTNTK
jgi:hypothetical protein